MKIQYSKKVLSLPEYLFAEIDRKKKELLKRKINIIDFSVGDPDLPTPAPVIKAMKDALDVPGYSRYPFGPGDSILRERITQWFKKRFGVKLDAEKEIHILIGSKEGLAHIPFVFLNSGDITLCPQPSYPVYKASTVLSEGRNYFVPLKDENGYLPDLDSIPEEVKKKAKILFINYPNNPTGATATYDFFNRVVEFAKKYNVIIIHDNAYSEIYEKEKPLSFLQINGAKDVGVEFHSFSKTYNMTGWRIGWVCGNRDIIRGLAMVKENIDSGVFRAIQKAALAALDYPEVELDKLRGIYAKRKTLLSDALVDLGYDVKRTDATFYLWVKIPKEISSTKFVSLILEKVNVVVTPGIGFGPDGEGFIRFSLTIDEKHLREGIERIKRFKI